MDATWGASEMATYHDTPAGVAAPPVPLRKSERSGERSGERTSHRRRRPIGATIGGAIGGAPLQLVRDDRDEALREVIRALREQFKPRLGPRELQKIGDALRPERRPQTYLLELAGIFGKAGASRERLRLTLGAWLDEAFVIATPDEREPTLGELHDAVNKEGHEALRALHEHLAAPRCESRLRTVVREVREFVSVGGRWLDRGAETLCARRHGL